jgi:dihydropteroate synthase
VTAPRLVGVINLSPESRNRDTVFETPDAAVRRAAEFRRWGAAVVEIGARSSSVEAARVDEAEEQRRLVPVLRALKREAFTVSVDTWGPATAAIAAAEGADIVNFTSAEAPDDLLRAVAGAGAAFVMVHMPFGDPYAMREAEAVVPSDEALRAYFDPRIAAAEACGIRDVILDPNLGIVHSSIRANREFLIAYRASLAFRFTRLYGGSGHGVMLDHPRRDAGDAPTVWGALLLALAPAYLRTHDVDLVSRLSDAMARLRAGRGPASPS